jgi:N-formylglutamate amidohydrolase
VSDLAAPDAGLPTSRPGCFNLQLPLAYTSPIVFSSPHSGRMYDPEFLAVSRLDALTLRRSEDSFVDEIFAAVPALGGALIAAEFPRAWCDVNRERWELDPAMFEDMGQYGQPTGGSRAGYDRPRGVDGRRHLCEAPALHGC